MKFGVPKSKAGQFCFFFVAQFLSYFLVVANTRAYTQGRYVWTAFTDILFAAQAFLVLRKMIRDQEATGFWAGSGYVLGGTCGSLLSIFVTTKLYGH